MERNQFNNSQPIQTKHILRNLSCRIWSWNWSGKISSKEWDGKVYWVFD